MSDVFSDEVSDSDDMDFEFDASIANVPDGPVLVQVQGAYWSQEYKADRGLTTYGVMVMAKIVDDGHEGEYNGQFVNKFIWLGNDKPDPRGVRNFVQFAESALHEPQTGTINKNRYNPETRTVRDKQKIALADFDDCYVIAVLSTKEKDGQANQEIVAWRSDEGWESDES